MSCFKWICSRIPAWTMFALAASVAGRVDATIIVTPNANANALAAAVTAIGGPGIVVTNAIFSGQSSGGIFSSGTFTADGGTYGLFGSGIVLSTGNAAAYGSGPNLSTSNETIFGVSASAAQNALLSPITGQSTHFDVSELVVTFNTLPGFSNVFFNVVFGSEEFPEYVTENFKDGFGLFVNGTNIAFNAGLPINISHPAFAPIAGTELDGVLAPGGKPVVTFNAAVGSGSVGNTLRFIIADALDARYDSTTYISALGGTAPPTSVIPEPASFMVWSIGSLMGVLVLRRKRTT